MSEYELHALSTDLLRDMDHMIEFWLQGTFAVIVARFVGGQSLSRAFVRLIAILYLAATIMAFTRYGLASSRVGDYGELLVSQGYAPFSEPGPVSFPLIGLSFLILVLIGTLATVYFLLWHGPFVPDARSADPPPAV